MRIMDIMKAAAHWLLSLLLLGILGLTGYFWVVKSPEIERKRELERDQRLLAELYARQPYGALLVELDSTNRSLRRLIAFVEEQRTAIQYNENLLARLTAEESALKPVVEADRALVTAILSAEADKRHAEAWRERVFSFLLGVLASLFAAVLYGRSRKRAIEPVQSGGGDAA